MTSVILCLGCPLELLGSFKEIPVLGSTMDSDGMVWGGDWAEVLFYTLFSVITRLTDRLQFHHRPGGEAEAGR